MNHHAMSEDAMTMDPMIETIPLGWDETEDDDSSPDLFALLCERRGWTQEFLDELDDDSHAALKDIDAMIEALEDARCAGKVVTIAPDYDMDGISSGVLGYAGLKELGFDVRLHVPDYRRGHDLTPEDVEEIRSEHPDTSVMLTCDGGINSRAGIELARSFGWQTLVTDHHEELPPGSAADITVDPCRIDETYALRGICGAHVLHQVLETYAQRHRPDKVWEIRLLRLFGGLGTVSDVMPVVRENRAMVRDSLSIARLLRVPAPKTIENRWGGFDPDPEAIDIEKAPLLRLLRAGQHDPAFLDAFEGFALLLKAFAQHGKVKDVDGVNEGFYGFYAAPAMNSARRTGAPMADCFAVFTADGPDAKIEAAHRVIENNELRKQMTIELTAELLEGDQPLAPWVYFSSASAGMFGLLASSMMQRGGHPVVVMNRPTSPSATVSGSGRAPGWFDFIGTLEAHEGLWAVGHQQACGVNAASAEHLDELARVLEESTRAAELELGTEGMAPTGDLVLGASPEADASLNATGALLEMVRRIESLAPFGQGFREPTFEIVLDAGRCRIDRIGTTSQHLRIVAENGMACLWWNAAEEHGEQLEGLVEAGGQLRALAKLQTNVFRGETRLQAVIDQLLP